MGIWVCISDDSPRLALRAVDASCGRYDMVAIL